MKKLFVLFIIAGLGFSYPQSGLQKISTELDSKLKSFTGNEEALVWVFFKDKGNGAQKLLKTPVSVVSQKSVERRMRNLPASELIDETDLPVNAKYIETLTGAGFRLKQVSKWLNGVSGYLQKSNVEKIASLSFVNSLESVARLRTEKTELKTGAEVITSKPGNSQNSSGFDYGVASTQVNQIRIPEVHNTGNTGQGVVIGIFDAGFNTLEHEVFANLNIVARYDFVNNRTYVGDGNGGQGEGSHGTMTLSALAGYKPGKLIGPAFSSKYVLAKTENTDSETPLEEDNWVRAMEWADSIGIDVATTSLGYLDFDAPYTSYTWQNMDGKTCKITKAADLAFQKGIVVLNSAGNEGFSATHNTLGAPADGFYVLTVGAVTSGGARASFSSVGNTVDGRTKPDIMAMGQTVAVAAPGTTSGYTYVDGTSLSCPLAAGVAALVLSAKPQATAASVRDALRNTASNHNSPNREIGWGIIDAVSAISNTVLPVELSSFSAVLNDRKVTLSWKTSSEKNNLGFDIERSFSNEKNQSNIGWLSIGFVKGNGTTTGINNYSFSDNLSAAGNYSYRLKQKDYDGTFSYSGEVNVSYLGPESVELYQNYPNPFNPSTKISFTISEKSNIRLSLFDPLGKEAALIYSGQIEKGAHSIDFNAKNLASGAYFMRLTDGKTVLVRKVLLLK